MIFITFHLKIVVSAEVDWYKGHPHDTGAVHGKRYVLGLIEVLRDLPGLEGVHCAQDDQEDVVQQRHDRGHLAGPAPQHQLALLVVRQDNVRLLEAQPGESPDYLWSGHPAGKEELIVDLLRRLYLFLLFL